MEVNVRLFAMLRQQAGWRSRGLELADEATVADAWRELVALHPALEASTHVVRFARNGRYAEPTERLAAGDELVVIPPVAGGSDPPDAGERLVRLELTSAAIADDLLTELRRTVPTERDGALVLFVGQTRETPGTPAPGQEAEAARFAGSRVIALEYEAFEEMTVAVLQAIAEEIGERFGVHRLAIIHRVGRVVLAKPSVVVAAAAAHRGAAFDACRYAIEELKARAPIWKSEEYADGSVWVGAPARPGPRDGLP